MFNLARQTRRTDRKRPTLRPTLEALEDRFLPSTLTVTTNADGGTGSLRAQIASAHSGDTIAFAPALSGQTITLTTGELYIKHGVNINGPGAANLTISGGNTSRVFEVDRAAKKVTLSGLTISDAYSILNPDHTVTGGAVENHGELTIRGCTLSNNTGGNGGAIENDGSLTVNGGSAFQNNTASNGGGIYSHHTGTLTVSDTTLSDNTAPRGLGGGINTDCPTTISGCILTHNSAISGGGIISSGPITITGSTLSLNAASDSGGGIYCVTNAYYQSFTATVTGTTLSDNSAVKGGAIFTGNPGMTLRLDGGTTLSGNSATYGGGIYIYSGALTVSSCTLSSNTASSAGGGIYVLGTYRASATVSNSSFSADTPDNIFGVWLDGGGNTFA